MANKVRRHFVGTWLYTSQMEVHNEFPAQAKTRTVMIRWKLCISFGNLDLSSCLGHFQIQHALEHLGRKVQSGDQWQSFFLALNVIYLLMRHHYCWYGPLGRDSEICSQEKVLRLRLTLLESQGCLGWWFCLDGARGWGPGGGGGGLVCDGSSLLWIVCFMAVSSEGLIGSLLLMVLVLIKTINIANFHSVLHLFKCLM